MNETRPNSAGKDAGEFCPKPFPMFPSKGPACRLAAGHGGDHELNDVVTWTDGWKPLAERDPEWLSDVLERELPCLARHSQDRLIDAILGSSWLKERDRMVAERAWTEGAAKARQYRDDLDLAPLNPYVIAPADGGTDDHA